MSNDNLKKFKEEYNKVVNSSLGYKELQNIARIYGWYLNNEDMRENIIDMAANRPGGLEEIIEEVSAADKNVGEKLKKYSTMSHGSIFFDVPLYDIFENKEVMNKTVSFVKELRVEFFKGILKEPDIIDKYEDCAYLLINVLYGNKGNIVEGVRTLYSLGDFFKKNPSKNVYKVSPKKIREFAVEFGKNIGLEEKDIKVEKKKAKEEMAKLLPIFLQFAPSLMQQATVPVPKI